ncbi:MAG TPA: RHS repeat-associated core domain-containing protein [Actinomycetota bacterium]|nr:RHS repeat-associated core domain-containing protein [Actinomycetota bacterium]
MSVYRTQGASAVSSAQPGGSSGAWTARFAYTPAGFLSTAQGPTDAAPVAYLPDDAGNDRSTPSSTLSYSGNRLTQTVSVPTGTVTTYGYDHLGEQTTQTTGSSVTTTAYDAAGHPQKVTSPDGSWVAYAYDIAGRLVSRQDSSSPAELDFYGGSGSQLVEATGVSGTATAAYLLDSSGSPVAQQTTANGPGTWSSFVTDPHDNDAALVDTSGHVVAAYAYDVLGNLVSQTAASGSSSTWASRLKFQMAPEDPKLGVYTLGPRLLDPRVGRFTSADNWVASEGDLALQADPLTGNRYLYAGANPAGMIDNGYCWWLPHSGKKGCPGGKAARAVESVVAVLTHPVAAQHELSTMDRCGMFNYTPSNCSATPADKVIYSTIEPGADSLAPLALAPLTPASDLEEGFGAAAAIDGAESSAGASSTADLLSQLATKAESTVGRGSGSVYGTLVHTAFRNEIEALGDSNLTSEVSYLRGKVVPWGTPGSVRLDVVEGDVLRPTEIYDLKTGSAKLTAARVAQVRANLPSLSQSVPITEIRP